MRVVVVVVLCLFSLSALAAKKPRLVLLDVTAEAGEIDAARRRGLGNAILAELNRYEQVQTMSIAEIRSALSLEAERETVGCDGATCAAEIADAFGARYVTFTTLSRLGGTLTLGLSLYDSDEARIIGRGTTTSTTVPGLRDELESAVAQLMTTLGKASLPPAATPTTTPTTPTAPVLAAYPPIALDDVPLTQVPLTVEMARAVCGYVAAEDVWRCRADDVVTSSAGKLTTAGAASFAINDVGGCPTSMKVTLTAVDEDVTVDWSESAVLQDGALVGRMDGPRQVVPAGARVERMTALPPCAAVTSSTPAVLAVTVPFRIGDQPARVTFVHKRVRGAQSERALLDLVPEPALGTAPAVVLLDDGGSAWTLGSVLAGVGAGVVTGAAVGAVVMPTSASSLDRALVGAGWGAVAGVVVGGPLAIVGWVVDRQAEDAVAAGEAAQRRWQQEQRVHEAWQRRLKG
ncbi:MAG: hypothetical protein Q8O67_04760 [Deltaproteobacteria bacterium]|nr:hypothetical protein [Deltaproteobacteria bacterium]